MKRLLVKTLTIGAILCCTSVFAFSQQNNKAKKPIAIAETLPTAFVLGENDKAYDELMAGQSTLLDACDNDMKFAYHKLMGMMKEMEAHAVAENFDLKGINAWIYFFWRPDGNIDHIGFHLKPNSRNLPNEQLKTFFEGFAKSYKLNLKYNKKFSHYASFSFPLIRHEPANDNSKSTAKVNSSKGVRKLGNRSELYLNFADQLPKLTYP